MKRVPFLVHKGVRASTYTLKKENKDLHRALVQQPEKGPKPSAEKHSATMGR